MERLKLKNFKDELKRKEFQRIYLLHGEERFLVNYYAQEIKTAVKDIAICDTFDETAPVSDIIMTADSLPFFGDKRVIYIRDSKLFTSGRKSDSEKMEAYLSQIPNETTLVFIESDIDRRSRIYKKVAEIGCLINCQPLTPQDLPRWVEKVAKSRGKMISSAVTNKLIRTVGNNLSTLYQELDKLIHYCGEHDITPVDVDEICSKNLEARIFDLTKALGFGKILEALTLYRNMLLMKESPVMILSMIIRQFRIILLTKCGIEKGMSIFQISKELKIHEFAIKEAVEQGQRFTSEKLIAALKYCQDTDTRIKQGIITPDLGVEILIIKQG